MFPALFKKRLEFRDGFQVARATRGALELDKPFERDAKELAPKGAYFFGLRKQLLIGPAARDFTQKINVAQSRCQGEI